MGNSEGGAIRLLIITSAGKECDAVLIGAFEAKNRLSELLDAGERGSNVVITRCGKPVARLVPVAADFDRARARRAADGLRETSCGLSVGSLRIKALIEDGRA